MAAQNDNNSVLGTVFAVIGIIAALATGSEQHMEGGPTFLLMLILAVVGYLIGRVVELVVFRILFLIAAIIMFLMNVAIRHFVWHLISALFGG